MGNQVPTLTDLSRGIQWRLMMTFSGFEIFWQGLNAHLLDLDAPDDIPKFTNLFFTKTRPLRKYFSKDLPFPIVAPDPQIPEIPNPEKTLESFLLIAQSQKDTFHRFFVQNKKINGMGQLISAGTMLRHLIAHGVLSPSKILQWHLVEYHLLINRSIVYFVIHVLRTLENQRSESENIPLFD